MTDKPLNVGQVCGIRTQILQTVPRLSHVQQQALQIRPRPCRLVSHVQSEMIPQAIDFDSYSRLFYLQKAIDLHTVLTSQRSVPGASIGRIVPASAYPPRPLRLGKLPAFGHGPCARHHRIEASPTNFSTLLAPRPVSRQILGDLRVDPAAASSGCGRFCGSKQRRRRAQMLFLINRHRSGRRRQRQIQQQQQAAAGSDSRQRRQAVAAAAAAAGNNGGSSSSGGRQRRQAATAAAAASHRSPQPSPS